MSTVHPYLQSLGFLGNPWVILPVMAILLAIVVYRLRRPILAAPARIWNWGARRVPRSIYWIRRNYLWFIVIGVLFGYAWIVWLITWELPFIADGTVAKLREAVESKSPNGSNDVRNYAYALGALLAGIAILATMPFALIKTWINERQATTAEQGHITDRLTKAIEQLGAEKSVKVRARTYEYVTGTEDAKVLHTYRQLEGEALPEHENPEIAATYEFGDWGTFEETVPNLEVRLGAIYALERIAQDSERDHITVMETLCAYIRENAAASSAQDHDLGNWPDYPETEQPVPPTEQSDPSNAPSFPRRRESPADSETDPRLRGYDDFASTDVHEARDALLKERQKKLNEWASALPAPRVDIQAALTVIGRRNDDRIAFEWRQERPFTLDLRRTNLQNAYLHLAKLDHALLNHARMEGADLREAQMERANLAWARMERAYLAEARMEGADLREARMERANLAWARMEGADLSGARMERASLAGARMEGGDLGEARMEGADLWEARMEGAKFHSADLKSAALTDTFADTSVIAADLRSDSVSQEMLNNLFGDAATRIPDDLTRPNHWDKETLRFFRRDLKFEAWLKARRGSGA